MNVNVAIDVDVHLNINFDLDVDVGTGIDANVSFDVNVYINIHRSVDVKMGADVDFDVEVFFDGDCPLCVREIDMLRRLDRRERIRFTDIAESSFDSREVGVDWNTLMARIHGRLPDGTLIEGVEVFRRLYAAAGFPRLVAATRLSLIHI